MFISPMLAAPMPKVPLDLSNGQWAAEEKFDGHRLIIEVSEGSNTSLLSEEAKHVQAWGRYGIARILPVHIIAAMEQFPVGIYDGELLAPGKRSYGVTELIHGPDLVYTIFDVLHLLEEETMSFSYTERREYLKTIFSKLHRNLFTAVVLAGSTTVSTNDQIQALLKAVWARDGEGLILKRTSARYSAGKRTKDFIKLKQLQTAVLTIVGFEASKGAIMNRGAFATVVLEDDETPAHRTTVKTRNDLECRKFEEQHRPGHEHPAIGRRLRIEYQERTPDGNYRHPRWDRFEDE